MRIGLDVGSLTAKGVLIGEDGRVLAQESRYHNGDIVSALKELLFALVDGYDRNSLGVAMTGGHAQALEAKMEIPVVDTVTAEIAGARKLFGDIGHILHVGGGSLMLISLDDQGNLLSFNVNSACAAGTGSFLDEQAARMGFDCESAAQVQPMEKTPSVATRCAVFAKTDLIHRQQEGFSKSELWCGLCRGMSRTTLQTLLKGRELQGEVAVTGGVAQNKVLVHYLKETLGRDVLVSPHSAFCAALGAALIGPTVGAMEMLERLTKLTGSQATVSPSREEHRPVLQLKKSTFPDFTVTASYTDEHKNEIRIHEELSKGTTYGVLVGIDVGSTSTKLALAQEDGRVLVDIYRRTQGDPIGAARLLIQALGDIQQRYGVRFEVLACGTTGSGRKIVGMVVGADLVVNEITAHVRGSVSVDQGITTIFEIGGQDSKYMRLRNGHIVDANMNYVCAAGTGTFVEELGRKLGFSLEEIGEKALGHAPPHTSDRCTVFMEQDAFNLTREGVTREQVMAAILYSVIENYKTKVVGNRPVSKERVMFQGATARNKGLVAAIENVFGVEVVVSPYCHVLGALGAAMLAREHVQAHSTSSKFRGLELVDRKIDVSLSNCELCSNRCVITTAHIEGVEGEPSFGYLCGREPEEKRMRKNLEFAPMRSFRSRLLSGTKSRRKTEDGRPRVGIPMALASWGYAPLFQTLIRELGMVPVFSPETDREITALGAKSCGSDFCFPVKVAHGHVAFLREQADVDAVFVPAVMEEERNDYTTRRRFCAYLEALPSIVCHIFLDDPLGPPMVDPNLDLNLSSKEIARRLQVAFAPVKGLTLEQCKAAWEKAVKEQRMVEQAAKEHGRRILEDLKRSGKPGLVIIGRPYNTLDPTVSINLPLRASELGIHVLHMVQLPFKPELLGPEFKNMYWNYGQKIISAVRQIAETPNLFGIYLTSFNCGPDSFILTMAEEAMGDKPFLILELDEHGSDGGYVTRLEAFLDVVKAHGIRKTTAPEIPAAGASPKQLRERIIWVPRLHPYTTYLFAAVLRGHGFDARPLPETDHTAHSLGKAATRGSECMPMAVTLGTFMKTVKESGIPMERHALFMPTATGPCRFGAYAQTQFMALRKHGFGDVPILSPSSENAYLGIPRQARKELWDAILAGDMLFKLACAHRPYEVEPGSVDRVARRYLRALEEVLQDRKDPMPVLLAAARAMVSLPRQCAAKPLVGVVGEIYVRCEPFSNANVIEAIERAGGEAWLAPFSEWILYTVWCTRNHGKLRGDSFWTRVLDEFGNIFIEETEHRYAEAMRPYLSDRMEPPFDRVIEAGGRYINDEFEGESILTVGRAILFLEQGADLVVNAAPFSCMHGHISGAIFQRVMQEYNRPVVTMVYDGTTTNARLRSFILAAQDMRRQKLTHRTA